jgi:phage replication-related protein YjqB (UPF0714/DUF867 family)
MDNQAKYLSFQELALHETGHYRIEKSVRDPRILIFTPHGGGIEPGTSEIVCACAGTEFSYYCFEGILPEGNERLHITSTNFNEPTGIKMLAEAEIVVTIHGCGSKRKIIFVGGLETGLIAQFVSAFQRIGIHSEKGAFQISGESPRNICNHGKNQAGVQIEFCEGLRREMFMGLDRVGRTQTTPLFDNITSSIRAVLLKNWSNH